MKIRNHNKHQLFGATRPIPVIVGVFLDADELRWRMTRWGATAYEVKYGPCGGLKYVRVLRTKNGAIVCCPDWNAGCGDLIEKIETLAKTGELKDWWRERQQ